MEELMKMEVGHIYSISFGGVVQLVGRYKNTDACYHYFFTYLHYWEGYEEFYGFNNPYCVKNGIAEIREATPCEKQTLCEFEIEQNAL